MRAIYYAEDGKEFNNEKECRKYETSMELLKNSVRGFNSNLQEIDKSDIRNFLENYIYIDIPSVDSLESLKIVSKEYGYSYPNEVGTWCYDGDTNSFMNADIRIKQLKEELDILQELKKMQ